MIITNWLWWMWVLGAGFGIGLFFYGGLWITVQQLPKVAHPGPLFLASFLGRTVLSTLGFYLLIGSQLENAVIAMAGFLFARIIVVRGLGASPPPFRPTSSLPPSSPNLERRETQRPESLYRVRQ